MVAQQVDLQAIIDIAVKAGEKILDIYENSDFEKTIDFKADDSPLTVADKESHNVIMAGLEKLDLGIPILSEEGEMPTYEERKQWTSFWCVDPLDGTKEFINKNGQFTVNIALIEDKKPVLGVVYTPVTDTLYYGSIEEGAFIKEGENGIETMSINNKPSGRIAVQSKSHASDEETELLKKYDVVDTISVGSSLKFCMVACGKADIYYRHGPTMEWDTAAGQAVVEAAGGKVLDGDVPFRYNKENLLNGSFLCLGF